LGQRLQRQGPLLPVLIIKPGLGQLGP
jgi:hypothetical protein